MAHSRIEISPYCWPSRVSPGLLDGGVMELTLGWAVRGSAVMNA
jgi:hypothetical protein